MEKDIIKIIKVSNTFCVGYGIWFVGQNIIVAEEVLFSTYNTYVIESDSGDIEAQISGIDYNLGLLYLRPKGVNDMASMHDNIYIKKDKAYAPKNMNDLSQISNLRVYNHDQTCSECPLEGITTYQTHTDLASDCVFLVKDNTLIIGFSLKSKYLGQNSFISLDSLSSLVNRYGAYPSPFWICAKCYALNKTSYDGKLKCSHCSDSVLKRYVNEDTRQSFADVIEEVLDSLDLPVIVSRKGMGQWQLSYLFFKLRISIFEKAEVILTEAYFSAHLFDNVDQINTYFLEENHKNALLTIALHGQEYYISTQMHYQIMNFEKFKTKTTEYLQNLKKIQNYIINQ